MLQNIRMLQDIVNQPDQFSNDDLSSPKPFSVYNPQLFLETIQTPEVTSGSNGCYDENSSHASNNTFPQDVETNTYQENNITSNTTIPATANTTSTVASSANAINNNGDLSIMFDSPEDIENNISASADFSTSPEFLVPPYSVGKQDEFDLSSISPGISAIDVVQEMPQYNVDPGIPLIAPPLPTDYGDNYMSSVSSYVPLSLSTPPCSFRGPAIGSHVSHNINNSFSMDNSVFGPSLLAGSVLQTPKLEYPIDNSLMFCPDPTPRIFNAPEFQVLGTDNQTLAGGAATGTTSLTSEITSLDDPTLKVGKLTVEQKREKIQKFLKKRNERNFGKKIKYACRKTLADSRPRVRGRFAKNDDYGESQRNFGGNHEEDVRYIFDMEGSQSPGLVYY